MKTYIIKLIKIGLVSIFLLFISVLTACSAKISYDFEVLTKVAFKGYDGFGEIVCSNNMELINAMVLEDLNKFGNATKFSQSIEYSFENSKNLKNGDVVEIFVNYDEKAANDLNLKIINKKYSIKVEGLKELESKKIEDFINVNYNGVIPVVDVTIKGASTYISDIKDIFTIEQNGREITISLSHPEKIAEYGYLLEPDTMKIVMDDANEYIYTDSVPSNDIMSWYNERVIEAVENEVNAFIVTSTGFISALTSITTGANEIAESFYGDKLNGDVFILGIDKLELKSTYYNSLKDITKSKELGFNPTICSMFYVFDLTMKVKSSEFEDGKELSGILVYWLGNPMITADGNYTQDKFVRIASYKTYQEFIDNHLDTNKELFNLNEVK